MLHRLETRLDSLRGLVRSWLGLAPRVVVIVPYRGFGNRRSLTLIGRVLGYRRAPAPQRRISRWANIVAAYRRFETDEVPEALVLAAYGPRTAETLTDEEGYFRFDFEIDGLVEPDAGWQTIDLVHPAPPGVRYAAVTAAGQALIPPASARFGVISDIDDTILQSGATRPMTMLRNVVLRNAQQRLSFPGAAAFYHALQAGQSGHEGNPLFYVSSSPWNLYDMLVDFMAAQRFPAGPLLLRDIGIDANKLVASSHQKHKTEQIATVLGAYPQMPFVLIGDSGQHDPEIYAQIVQDYPGRVAAIYIRHVSSPARGAQIRELARRVQVLGVDMLLTDKTIEAARHAVRIGLIAPEAATGVEQAG